MWKDVFPAVTTQLHEDQTLDLDATSRHIEVLIDSGIAGLIVCGSLGENQALDPVEKRAVVEMAVSVSRGRVAVLSGVAETSTQAAIFYVQDCAKLGADGFMIMRRRALSAVCFAVIFAGWTRRGVSSSQPSRARRM